MITRLNLISFRNHMNLDMASHSKVIVISGDNGVGKTNVLEAISLLSPGRSMRNCKLDEIIPNTNQMMNQWGVHATVEDGSIYSTGYAVGSLRKIKKDGENLKAQSDILHDMRILWLLPQTENIFLNASTVRRKFLDRMCYNLFPEHAKNILRYEYYLKSRMKVLQQESHDRLWLDSIENNLSTLTSVIHSTRDNALNIIKDAIAEINAEFLQPIINLNIASKKDQHDIEFIRHSFKNNRVKDRQSGRSHFGAHREDMIVLHPTKNQKAEFCSTGEQKSFLVAMLIAQARAIRKMSNIAPIMLMDEVLSHFDMKKQAAVLQELCGLSSQIWITTTKSFSEIAAPVEALSIHL